MGARVQSGWQQHLRQIQLITANSSEGVIMIDVNQEIKWANAAALAMHAVTLPSELGRTIDEYHANFQVKFRGSPAAPTEQAIESVASGESFRDVVIEVTPLMGETPRWVYRVRNLVLVDEGGSPTCVVLVLRRLEDVAGARGHFSASVMALPNAAAVLRLHDARLIEANTLFLDMIGRDGEAIGINGIPAADFVALCADPELVKSRLEQPRPNMFAETLRQPDGQPPRPVLLSSAPVSIDGNRAVLINVVDAAAARGVAFADGATDTFAEIRSLCELAPNALHVLDGDMRIRGVSQPWLDWLAYSRDAVLGRQFIDFLAPSSAAHFETHTWEMLSHAGTARDVEVSFIAKSGDMVDALVTARATLDEGGAPRLVVAAPVDITARKRSQAAFDTLFALSPVPMLIRKLDDPRILDINEAFSAATGHVSESVAGHSVDELGIFENKTKRQHFENALRADGKIQNMDAHLKTAAGELLDCLLSAEKVHAFGQTCLLMILQDVSDRRRSEMELFQAIEKVMGDTSWFSRSVIEKLAGLRSPPRTGSRSSEIGDLTPREREVLALISQGMADADIAAKLGLTRSTVRNHVATLYSKIGVHSRSSAIIWARERGINFAWSPGAESGFIRNPLANGKPGVSTIAIKGRRA